MAPQSRLRKELTDPLSATREGPFGCGGRSVHVGDDAVGHALAVLVPRQAVLPPALALVPGLAVHEQHGEVDHVEVGQDVLETTREGPGQGHDEVAQVVGVANEAPPSGN